MKKAERKHIYDIMIDYANNSWKACIYESERESIYKDYESKEVLNDYIRNLEEDIECDSNREDTKIILKLVKTLL